jgi:molybdopterin-guanine dinucleotide biosynthesis protein A
VTAPVYILAGGGSERFGSDKARITLEGEPLLVHAARGLAPAAATEVTVVADRAGKYEDLGYRTVADLVPGLGPVGGLQTALADLGRRGLEGWLLLGACDMVGLEAGWIAALVQRASPASAAVAFRHRRWEPMPALFHTRAAAVVADAVAAGELALWRVIERCSPVALPLPAGWERVAQINTPAALERYLELRQ